MSSTMMEHRLKKDTLAISMGLFFCRVTRGFDEESRLVDAKDAFIRIIFRKMFTDLLLVRIEYKYGASIVHCGG